MNDEFPYYSILEAAEVAEESFKTIQRRIRAGVIKAIKASSGTFIKREELEKYLKIRGMGSLHVSVDDVLRQRVSVAEKVEECGHEHN